MPHITFECTRNVSMNFEAFFKELSEQLVETGHASKMGVKSRVVSSDIYYIIDGNPEYKMVNLLFRLREGRAPEVKQRFSEIGLALLNKYLEEEVKNKTIILSTEIKELIKGQDLTQNAIR